MKAKVVIPFGAFFGVLAYLLLMAFVVMLALGALHTSLPGVPALGYLSTFVTVAAFRMLLTSVQR